MTNWQAGYFWGGWFAGSVVISLEIGWWSLLVAFVMGFVIQCAATAWTRRFGKSVT